MSIEAMKHYEAALLKAFPKGASGDVFEHWNKARQAIAEAEQDKPVAWMHVMDNTEGLKANGKGIVSVTQKRKHPFGKAGVDFSKSYPVTSTPLYTHPQPRKPVKFPTMLRQMWSGGEVQAWLDEHVNKE